MRRKCAVRFYILFTFGAALLALFLADHQSADCDNSGQDSEGSFQAGLGVVVLLIGLGLGLAFLGLALVRLTGCAQCRDDLVDVVGGVVLAVVSYSTVLGLGGFEDDLAVFAVIVVAQGGDDVSYYLYSSSKFTNSALPSPRANIPSITPVNPPETSLVRYLA